MPGSLLTNIADRIDQLDDQFCLSITGCRFAPEDHRAPHKITIGIIFNGIVKMDHMERIKQLTFIFVQPFYLTIKERIGAHHRAGILLDDIDEPLFISTFYLPPLLAKIGARGGGL